MEGKRLSEYEFGILIEQWPEEFHDLVHELRNLVLAAAPEVDETVAFSALSYSLPGAAYGKIGGSVCMIGPKDSVLVLGFLHGSQDCPSGPLARACRRSSTRDVRRS